MFPRPVQPRSLRPATQLDSEELHTMSSRFVSTTHVRNRVARALTCLALAAVAFLPAARASAQTNTGSIRGYVRGADGAPVPDAQVTAVDSLTSITRNAVSNSQGFYSLNALQPARVHRLGAPYWLQSRRCGDSRAGRPGIESRLRAERPSAQQLAQVTVTGGPPAETRSTEAATNVTQAQINQLPTPSRNILDLAAACARSARHAGSHRRHWQDVSGGSAAGESGEPVRRWAELQERHHRAAASPGRTRAAAIHFRATRCRNSASSPTITRRNTRRHRARSSPRSRSPVATRGKAVLFIGLPEQGSRLARHVRCAQTRTSIRHFAKPDYSRYLFGGSAGGPAHQGQAVLLRHLRGKFPEPPRHRDPQRRPRNVSSRSRQFRPDLAPGTVPRKSRLREAHVQHERQAAA